MTKDRRLRLTGNAGGRCLECAGACRPFCHSARHVDFIWWRGCQFGMSSRACVLLATGCPVIELRTSVPRSGWVVVWLVLVSRPVLTSYSRSRRVGVKTRLAQHLSGETLSGTLEHRQDLVGVDALALHGHKAVTLERLCRAGFAVTRTSTLTNPPGLKVRSFFITDAGRAALMRQ